jgi:hypothetical protein
MHKLALLDVLNKWFPCALSLAYDSDHHANAQHQRAPATNQGRVRLVSVPIDEEVLERDPEDNTKVKITLRSWAMLRSVLVQRRASCGLRKVAHSSNYIPSRRRPASLNAVNE